MRSLVFQVIAVQFVFPLLVLAEKATEQAKEQATVDVLIFDKKYYVAKPFNLEELIAVEGKYEGVNGGAFAAVQAKINVVSNSVTITWPNANLISQQDNATVTTATPPIPMSVPPVSNATPTVAIAPAPVRRSKPNLRIQTEEFRPDYQTPIFVLSTNPDIAGGRRLLQVPEGFNIKQGDSVEISFTLDILNPLQQGIIEEITAIPAFSHSHNMQTQPLGDIIASGIHGTIYSVDDKMVMKTCLANKPGTIVPFTKWADIDYIENINRNDFRIGRLLTPENAKMVGPKYFEEGTIDISGNYIYYFTMEKIKGKPLKEEVEAARMALLEGSTSQLANIFLGMINALSRLHKAGVIHLDPHFGNFMRLEDGSLIPIDFGLSRIAIEWEQHIIKGLPISEKVACQTQPLRGDLSLGTDFSADLEFLTFMMLEEYILENFFGPPGYKYIVMNNKLKVLTRDWTVLDEIKQGVAKLNQKRDSVVTNLNDMLFLSPTLNHCRQHPSLDVAQLTESLREANGQLFPKNSKWIPTSELDSQVGDSGYLVKKELPNVEDRYLWPKYEEYKIAIINIEKNLPGNLHPSGNAPSVQQSA